MIGIPDEEGSDSMSEQIATMDQSADIPFGSSLLRLLPGFPFQEPNPMNSSERRRAFVSAWTAEDGATSFAEQFKYTIATSSLLTPTLSISMYGTDSNPLPMARHTLPTLNTPESSRETITLSYQRKPFVLLGACCTSLMALAFVFKKCTQAWMRSPLLLFVILIGIVELIRLLMLRRIDRFVLEYLIGPYSMECRLSRSPNLFSPRYLATGVPVPAWVADERVRIQTQVLHRATDLVKAAHAMDKSINLALKAIQEVETVSRGLSLSTPLPPISRLEAETFREEEDCAYDATSDSPTRLSRGAKYTQRLTPLRKALSEHVEQVAFHCTTIQRKLAPLVKAEELEQSLKLATPQVHGSPVRKAKKRPISIGSATRSFALAGSFAGSPSKNHLHSPSSSVRHTPLSTPPTSEPTNLPSSFRSLESPFSPRQEAKKALRHACHPRFDRLAIMQLRTRFEHMHSTRVVMLYHLLALDFSLQVTQETQNSLREYWDENVLNVLKELTLIFSETTGQMQQQLRDAVGLSQDSITKSASLHHHLGLADRITEMGRILRTMQCKLLVCSEGLTLPSVDLHGPVEESSPCSEPIESVFSSIRNDLLCFSSEWEAGLHIFQSTSSSDQHDYPQFDLNESGMQLESNTKKTENDFELVPFYELTENDLSPSSGQHDILVQALLDCTSTNSLPRAGKEEVFEGETQLPAVSQLSRDERIQRMREQRQQRQQQETARSNPLTMVTELKGVLAHRKTSLS
ncbi:hypothetical protein MYAM1_001801 [Malassezia yamatoensis]|uniref:Myosin-binding domain-containing protein n=1 Tax=Malassezia yamatoensis TaxID=253288 RepID=A0AAJ5YTL8_9BASI|nr:hypothetical protein MYAM1_001801 [Malassezia yamatoensis]